MRSEMLVSLSDVLNLFALAMLGPTPSRALSPVRPTITSGVVRSLRTP
jgi:hypothetical protein